MDLSPAESDTLDLLDAYVAELHAGRRPDRDRWLAEHPHLAAHLDCLEQLDRLAAPDPDSTQGLPPGSGPSLVGETLANGKYELLAELGRGGMGVVYKARQVDLERVVALKMVLAGSMASAEQLARFQAEAKVAAKVQHAHVIQVFETGQVNGLPFLVMQYIEGCSLADRLHGGRLDPDTAVRIVVAVARAVADLHAHGIVHRDLKPSNILLDANGQPYVTDFGLAKLVEGDSGLTQTGTFLGTPQYMAPEQAVRAREAGPAADVYSLGAILYECLTGRPPFREATPFETVLAVVEFDPPRPRQVNPKVPRVLEQVVLQCLEKDPARRFPSSAALADALAEYLRGELVTVRRPGPIIAVRRWMRRQPGFAARLIAFGIFAAIVVFNHFRAPLLRPYTLPVLGLLAIWAAVSWICQRGLWSSERGYWWAYVWSAADIILLTAVQLVTEAGVSPIIIGYPFLIAGASLWTRRRMVWVTTACAVIGYAGLMAFDIYTKGDDAQPAHRHVIFLVSLVVLGFLMAYQVDRVHALSRYYEGKPRE
ncbi:MAG TPA: serine/threonine-protein kinase [Gemmataceae bacterium]|jgi:serine/threonine-protein kinase|nr:serine/threonine-protein kinase [Gemmataceae bacterium]